MADGQAPGQPAGAQGEALEALQAAAASVQASVRAAEAVCAALEPMVGALTQAQRRGGGGSGAGDEWAGVERQGELLQQSVESLEGLVPLDPSRAAAGEQPAGLALRGMASPQDQHAASHAGVPFADASAEKAAAAAQAAAGETAPQLASALRTPRGGASKRRNPMPLQPAAPKRRAPKPAKARGRKSRSTRPALLTRHNWRYEDQQAYTAWAAAHPAEASIDAVWEPAEVVAVGTGSQGPVYLISWKGWEHEPALRSWHTTEDLRRYNWRPALLQHWAAGKPDRGAVAGM